MFKVYSTSPTFGKYSKEPINQLVKEGCDFEFISAEISSDEEKLVLALLDADALIVGIEKITGKIINECKHLKIIAKHGAGIDNIDVKAAVAKNIVIANAPGANRHAVADLVFGLFLSLARKIPQTSQQVINNKWPRVVGYEVFNKTIGVIGTGKIGKEVIRRTQGFNMKVLAFDKYPDQSLLSKGVTYTSLENLLAESDFITIHIDLNEATEGLIGRNEFRMMKNNSFLVNTARGGIVNEEDLFEALSEGEIAGAALDVFSKEPLENSPLLNLENFIPTPHMAGYTYEALTEVGLITSRNVNNVLNGKKAEFECLIK